MRATGWRILLGVALFFTAVVGCSSKDGAVLTEACNLYQGMTREQVRETMGQPNFSSSSRTRHGEGVDTWFFDSNNKSVPNSKLSGSQAWRTDAYYLNNTVLKIALLSPNLCFQE